MSRRRTLVLSSFIILAFICIILLVRTSHDTRYHPDIREIELVVGSAARLKENPHYISVFFHFHSNSQYPVRIDDPAVGASLEIEGAKFKTLPRRFEYGAKTIITDNDLFEQLVFDIGETEIQEGQLFKMEVDGAVVGATEGKFQVLIELSTELNSKATYSD